MNTKRIPLQFDIKSRDFDTTKDPLATNIFYDTNVRGTVYAAKRPGLISEITGSGLAQGTFYYEGVLYVWDDSKDPLVPGEYDITDPDDFGTFSALRDYSDVTDTQYRLVEFTPSPHTFETGNYIVAEEGTYPIPDNTIVNAGNSGDGPEITKINYNTVRYRLFTYLASSISGEATVTASFPVTPIVAISSTISGIEPSQLEISTDDGLTFANGGFMPNDVEWCSATKGSIYVAVAGWNKTNNGSLSTLRNQYAYSSDGTNWTGGTLPLTGRWRSVASSPSMFVATGNDNSAVKALISSPDGLTWTRYTWTGVGIPVVAYNGTVFCAYYHASGLFPGTSSTMTSSDGVNWTQTTLSDSLPITGAITSVNGNFYVYGADPNTVNNSLGAMSSDGINWSAGSVNDLTGIAGSNILEFNGIASDGNVWIVTVQATNGDSTTWYCLYSTDGINYTPQVLPNNVASREYLTVIYAGGKFIMCGEGARVLTSEDGLTWTPADELNAFKPWPVLVS
jgi:hypothetical protein